MKEVIEMNPYEKYRHVGFNVHEFIKLTREYPTDFVNYCEIVVTENGIIFLASPSHAQVDKWLGKKNFRNNLFVWYYAQLGENVTRAQRAVLNRLERAGLIIRGGESEWWEERRKWKSWTQ